jgi:hypothetical protein
MLFKLKNKFLKLSDNEKKCFYYDENFISDGHFLLRKSQVENVFQFLNPKGKIENSKFQNIIDQVSDSEKIYSKTKYIFETSIGLMRVFVTKENKKLAIHEEYTKTFKVSELKGKDHKSPCISKDLVVFMPAKLPESILDENFYIA